MLRAINAKLQHTSRLVLVWLDIRNNFTRYYSKFIQSISYCYLDKVFYPVYHKCNENLNLNF